MAITLSDLQREMLAKSGGTPPIYLVELDFGPVANLTILNYAIPGWHFTIDTDISAPVTLTDGVQFDSGASAEDAAIAIADWLNTHILAGTVFATAFGATVSIIGRDPTCTTITLSAITTNAAEISPYGINKTLKFVSGSTPYVNQDSPPEIYPCSLAEISSIATSIEVMTRAATIGAAELTFNDPNGLGFMRAILTRCQPKGRFIRIKIGFPEWIESNFIQIASYILDDFVPEPGKIVLRCGEPLIHSFEAEVTARMVCVHPLAAIRKILQDANVPDDLLDLSTLDEAQFQYSNISHWAISRNDLYPTPKLALIDAIVNNGGPEWTINTLDEPTRAKQCIDELGAMLYGSLLADEFGVYYFARFDPDASSVRDLTAADIADFEIIASEGQNYYNSISVKTSKSGGPLFANSDQASRLRSGISGSSSDFTFSFTTDWIGNTGYLASEIADGSTGVALHVHGGVCAGFAGSRPTETAVYRSSSYPTQLGSDRLDNDSDRHAYLMLIDLDTWNYEIVRSSDAAYFDSFREGSVALFDSNGDPISSGLIEEVTPYPGAPDGIFFGDPQGVGGVWPEQQQTFSGYFFRPHLDSPVRLMDRVVYTLDERNLYDSTYTGGWTFSNALDDFFLFFDGIPTFKRIIDITIPVAMVQTRLARFSNGCPIVRFRTSLKHVDLQVTDVITVTHPLYVEFLSDGGDNTIRWEIISKEISLLGDSPGVVYTCARVGSPRTETSVIPRTPPSFRPPLLISDFPTVAPRISDRPPVQTSGSGLSTVTRTLTSQSTYTPVTVGPVQSINYETSTVVLSYGNGTDSIIFDWSLTDDIANAWRVHEGDNDYLNASTVNGSERLVFGNPALGSPGTVTPAFSFFVPASSSTAFAVIQGSTNQIVLNTASGLLSITPNTAFAGSVTIGDAASDTVAINAQISTNVDFQPIGTRQIAMARPSTNIASNSFVYAGAFGWNSDGSTANGRPGGLTEFAGGRGGNGSGSFAGGDGGGVNFRGGTGGTGTSSANPGRGGDVNYSAGNAGSISGGFGGANGGDNYITAGRASGTGSDGQIIVAATQSSALLIGRTGFQTQIIGSLSLAEGLSVAGGYGTAGQFLTSAAGSQNTWSTASGIAIAGDVTGTLGATTVVDLTISGETRGDLLTRGASSWVRLAPGTSGLFLQSAGTGADLVWASAITAFATPSVNVVSDHSSFAAGSATTALRSDCRFIATTASAVATGATSAQGSSNSLARADHTHAVTDLAIASQATGDLLYFDGANWVHLPVAMDGFVLMLASGLPAWAAATGGTLDDAYDSGGAAAGREIAVDAGSPVLLSNSSTTTASLLFLDQDSTGDAAIRFDVNTSGGNPVTSWMLGVDNSASDVFKLSYAAGGTPPVLGTNDVLIANSSQVVFPAGSASVPGCAVGSAGTYGLYQIGTSVALTAAGALVLDMSTATGLASFQCYIRELAGSAAAVPYGFNADGDTGLYRIAADNPAMAANGALVQEWTDSLTRVHVDIRLDGALHDGSGNGTSSQALTGGSSVAWTTILGGDVGGSFGSLTVSDLTIASEATGSVIYFDGANWVQLAAGTDGYILTLASGIPSWAAASSGGGTLDDAYDFGGAAAGRTIAVDTGSPVLLSNSSSTTAALLHLDQDSTGDAMLRFDQGTATAASWAIGIDGSASGLFKFAYAASGAAVLGTGDVLILNSSQGIFQAGSASTPSVAVGSAGTYGMYQISTSLAFTAAGALVLDMSTATGLASFQCYIRELAGSAAAVPYGFISDGDTGMFRVGADHVGMAANSTQVQSWTDTYSDFAVPLLASTGSAAAPSISFTGDTDTGLYNAANTVAIATGGTLRATITNSAINSNVPFLGSDGSAGAPGFSFQSDTDSGLYRVGANDIAITTAGAYAQEWTSSVTNIDRTVRVLAGSAATPSYSWYGDTDTGIYNAADTIAFATGGTLRATITNSAINSDFAFRGPDGSAGTPSFSFQNDTNTGIFSAAADSIGLSTGGTVRVTLSTASLTSTLPLLAANGNASSPSYAFTNDADCGLYRLTTNSIGIATAGSLNQRWTDTYSQFELPVYAYPGGGTTDLSYAFSTATDSGIYLNASNTPAMVAGAQLAQTWSPDLIQIMTANMAASAGLQLVTAETTTTNGVGVRIWSRTISSGQCVVAFAIVTAYAPGVTGVGNPAATYSVSWGAYDYGAGVIGMAGTPQYSNTGSTGWTVTGSINGSGGANDITLVVAGATGVTVHWKTTVFYQLAS